MARIQFRTIIPVIAALLTLVSTESSRADVWELFNPRLTALRQAKAANLAELESLGDIKLGNTCEQIGSQYHMGETPPATPAYVQIDLGKPKQFDSIVVVPAVPDFSTDGRRSYAFPVAFRVDVSNDKEFVIFQSLAQFDNTELESEFGLPIVVRCKGKQARYVRLTVLRLANVADRWTYALGEVMVLDGNRNIAIGSKATMKISPKIPPKWHFNYLVDGRTPLGSPIDGDLPEFDGAYSAPLSPNEEKWMMIDLGEVMPLQEVRLHPIHARQGNSLPGYSFPRKFRVELFRDEKLQNGKVIFASDDEVFSNPGNNPVSILIPEFDARLVRITCIESSLIDPERMGLAEVMVFSDGKNVARAGTASMNGQSAERVPSLLNDGYGSYGKILDFSDWISRWERLRAAQLELRDTDKEIVQAEQVAYRRGRWAAGLSLATLLGFSLVLGFLRRRRAIRERTQFRQRLAQDLHDEAGSNLAAIARLGELAELESKDEQTQQDWQSVRQLALECTDSMRETLWLLGGPRYDGGDFFQRIQLTAERMLPHVDIDWKQPEIVPQFDEQSETPRQLFLMFKEVVANIAKHSKADRVKVFIEHDEALKIIIHDNGVGTTDESASGMGLSNIRQRTAKLGGRFTFDSMPSVGTTVMIEVPT